MPLDSENPWLAAEGSSLDACNGVFDDWRCWRDASAEALFSLFYKEHDDGLRLAKYLPKEDGIDNSLTNAKEQQPDNRTCMDTMVGYA